MTRVLCALSGGVDSSVAALLLQEAGHEVVAVFMRNGVSAPSSKVGSCCSASDARDAARVADKLGIPFYAMDYALEFAAIMEDFVDEYRKGRTPSPCVLCNQDLKFGHLFELADALRADAVATGHYARIEDGALLRPKDRRKDQSYFLFGIRKEELSRILFPLGSLEKDEVRALARKAGLSTADKAESMEVCFIPSNDYRDLLRETGGMSPGRFVSTDGKDLGAHEGYEAFTIGQRRGLPALGSPRYVIAIRAETKEVVLGQREALLRKNAVLARVNWLIEEPKRGERFTASVQIRARHAAAPALLEFLGGGNLRVDFAEAQEAVTPGQAAVLYQGERVIAGGWLGF